MSTTPPDAPKGPRKRQDLSKLTPEQRAAHRRAQKAAAAARARAKNRPATAAKPTGAVFARIPAAEQDLITRYLDSERLRLLPNTRDAYRRDLAGLSEYLGTKGLLAANHGDLQVYLSERTREIDADVTDGREWSMRTAHRKLSAFAGFYGWADREHLIPASPAGGLRLHPYDKSTPPRMMLPDWEKLIDFVEGQTVLRDDKHHDLYLMDALVLRLMYHLALRVTEAVTPRFSRLQRIDGELQLEVRRKGGRKLVYPLTGRVLDAYERWMLLRSEMTVPVSEHRDCIIIHPWTHRPVTRNRMLRRVRFLARKAGLPKELVRSITPHTFRHAQGYNSGRRGEPLPLIQSKLGHASIQSTQIYTAEAEAQRLQALRDASERD